jgi:hypothetical protein
MNDEYDIYCMFDSSFNHFYHNNFFDISPVYNSQAFDEGSNNFWYNATLSEGNFWSDWSGVGHYEIDGATNSTDLYPLSNPLAIL